MQHSKNNNHSSNLIVSRRDAVIAAAAAIAGSALVPAVGAAQDPKPAAPGASLASDHTVIPLPFKADSLKGISEKLIISHHENNYTSAVKSLNRAEKELSAITKDTPPFVVAALRERELMFRNSKTLHELYFSNLGGDGKAAPLEADITAAYGTMARFEEQFKFTGMGLSGGTGWVCLNFELGTGGVRIVASRDHTQAEALSIPVLVMDMYEHAYQMDYGAAAPKYIEAFFANINWSVAADRLARARKAYAAFKA